MPTKAQAPTALARFAVITFILTSLVSCGGGGSGQAEDNGNTASDRVKPVISILGSTNVKLQEGGSYNDPGAIATDNVDGSLTPVVSGTLGSAPGEYSLTYTATDRAGNSATATRRVTVIANSVVIDNGEAGAAWDLGIQGFDEDHVNGYSGSCSNGGGACPSLEWEVVSDDERGNVLQVSYAADAGHAGIYFKTSTAQDLSVYASGSLIFDIKVVSGGTNNLSGGFYIKMESGATESSALSVDAIADSTVSVDNQWQSISIPVPSLSIGDTEGDLDLSEITVAMNIFPVNGTGQSLVYQLDNARFVLGNGGNNLSPEAYQGYSLIWSDEFSGNSLNTDDWTYEIGDGCPGLCGWGNDELEYYRNENTTVANGLLTIEAREEFYGGKNYTSSRIKTEHKQFFKYGRIDIRAKMPQGQGLWPAVWMLGENISTVGWPASGEIDIMEMVGGNGSDGNNDSTTHGTIHWDAGDAGWDTRASEGDKKALSSGKLADDFHVFSIDWTSDSITWLLDGVSFHSEQTTSADRTEFHEDFFFIFNVAVGGRWPGDPDSSTQFPQQMQVDYVRVFQLD
jgi:beta-glucanase (GH16 family)